MSRRVVRSVLIARPVGDVFAFVSDLRNDPRWCDKVLSCEQVSGEGPGLGARYRVEHRPVRIRPATRLEIEVTEFAPPHRLRLREEDADGVFDVAYDLRAETGGTRLVQRDELDLHGLPRLLRPIGRFNVGRHLDQQFTALKSLLEQPG